MVRLPGKPGSKLFSTAYNSDYWRATAGEQAWETVRRSYQKACAWSRGSSMIQKAKFWQNPKDCDPNFYQIQKIARALAKLFVYRFSLQVCKP